MADEPIPQPTPENPAPQENISVQENSPAPENAPEPQTTETLVETPKPTEELVPEIIKSEPASQISTDPTNPNITITKTPDTVTITEVMEQTAHSESATAQIAGNEPLEKRAENLNKANATRQNKKRKKTDDILTLFAENPPTSLKLRGTRKITNDEVEKLLHVSDATATRYLETLKKEGKIRQVGKTGNHVYYEKI